MKKLPSTIKFKYPWRDYQQRVLDDLEGHLGDKKLHVIAPPGSGKTILGLEVVRRLNLPTLILSPTLAIRNQWRDRFVDLFLSNAEGGSDWISLDIHQQGFLTVSTYQALHSAISGQHMVEENEEEEGLGDYGQNEESQDRDGRSEFIDSLSAAGIKVLVVDECHHLKNEWWRSLTFLADKIDDLTVIALTATPPYDVSSTEWKRYREFCGPVDAEISVPELVRKGDLCPHQDFVYFSQPHREEGRVLRDYHEGVSTLTDGLKGDQAFKETILQHPYVRESDENIEKILDDPAFFASILVFLRGTGVEPDRKLFDILGASPNDAPPLTLEWFEILLTGVLFGDELYYKNHKTLLARVENDFRRCGAIERKTVTLRSSQKIGKLLTQSLGKLDSIIHIVDIERKALGENLRMVILTDFIRRADLNALAAEDHHGMKLGVIPIFEALRSRYTQESKLGVLCGTVVIIPRSALKAFRQATRICGVPPRKIVCHELTNDPEFLVVKNVGDFKHELVRIVTGIFEQGEIHVLVGTKSLLGEGWDSPSINALILASFVGSFVLSNQMRGRAIRAQTGNPDKVSAIWHLACNDPFVSSGGDDIETLTRRFSAFLGIASKGDVIEKGIARLDLGSPPFAQSDVERINAKMAVMAADRAAVNQAWQVALCKGTVLREEVKTPAELIPRGFVFNKTIRALLFQGISAGGYVAASILRGMQGARSSDGGWNILLLAFVAGSIIALPNTIKSLILYFRNGPIEGAIRLISDALLEALTEAKIIRTDPRKLNPVTEYDSSGGVFCFLDGATYYEASQFRASLLEILDPIDNPRYLVTRGNALLGFLRIDFHSVPELLGQQRATAEKFLLKWRSYIGPSKLIYTRTREGRRILVKARGYSLSSAFIKRSEVVSKWK